MEQENLGQEDEQSEEQKRLEYIRQNAEKRDVSYDLNKWFRHRMQDGDPELFRYTKTRLYYRSSKLASVIHTRRDEIWQCLKRTTNYLRSKICRFSQNKFRRLITNNLTLTFTPRRCNYCMPNGSPLRIPQGRPLSH